MDLLKCTVFALVLLENYGSSYSDQSNVDFDDVDSPNANLLRSIGGTPNYHFNCIRAGFFAHPSSRRKYYECVRHPANMYLLIAYMHTCMPPECFDRDHITKCSKGACSRNESATEFPCLKEHLQRDAQKTCQEETLTILESQKSTMIEFTASRGDPYRNLRLSLRDLNLETRSNYAKMIENTGKNVYPLLIATDGEPDYFGVGGVWKIYLKDGTMKRIVPVGPTYEIFKSLSHMVLGVFSVVSPYFLSPNSINWQSPLRGLQQRAKAVKYLLEVGETGVVGDDQQLALSMLEKVITYSDEAIKSNQCDIEGYRTFARGIAPLIEKAMVKAAEAHAEGTVPALMKLKEEMGDKEWQKLQVIIPTVWPVSLFNARLQVLEKLMSFDQIKNQVLIVEGALSESAAKTTMGRVFSDRAAAQLVWGGSEEESMKDHVFSLSTRRDLLSTVTTTHLNKVCESYEQENKPRCPFAGRASLSGRTTGTAQSNQDDSPSFATLLKM